MTHHIVYGTVGFIVEEEGGIITAATATGIPNPGAVTAHLIGKSYAAWRGRITARPRFISGKEKRKRDVRIYQHKHREEINTERVERRKCDTAYRAKAQQSSREYYKTHKEVILANLRERRRKAKRDGEKAATRAKAGNGT